MECAICSVRNTYRKLAVLYWKLQSGSTYIYILEAYTRWGGFLWNKRLNFDLKWSKMVMLQYTCSGRIVKLHNGHAVLFVLLWLWNIVKLYELINLLYINGLWPMSTYWCVTCMCLLEIHADIFWLHVLDYIYMHMFVYIQYTFIDAQTNSILGPF